MNERVRSLLQPLNLAGLFTLVAVGMAFRWMPPDRLPWAIALLSLYAVLMLAVDFLPRVGWFRPVQLTLMPLIALTLVWMDPKPSVAPVLLVVWTAVMAAATSLRITAMAVIAADIAFWFVLRGDGHSAPLTVVMIHIGFQLFAALCAWYAVSAERARDRLALVNADLLATRALLADSARDNERLRVARELHDVAGHKLTAMTLNLRALAADPAFAGRPEVAIAQQLSTELLSDIRGIVQAMRDDRGLDLSTALRALAAPMPRPSLRLHVAQSVHVTDPATAEAVLRLVQEALTNSARHADADIVQVSLDCEGDRLRIRVEDDGQVRGAIREGNGLSGMRERVVAAGGQLAFGRSERGSLRIDASLPA
ncbi:sensor histidine kinase [Lysobacter soli]|uniref:sensor histidine kinase n=1 Tax=Lysobacter soli TaxID=453783 RepID=UPI0012EE11A1|nr:histidine kinase [Lysobacter soli]QGW63473.1 sensor histidine kinase [Lysobacter soli]